MYRYLPDKYKDQKYIPSKENEAMLPSGNISGLMPEPLEKQLTPVVIAPRHETDVRVPGWLQRKFDELDREKAMLEHEELPKEYVHVITPEEEPPVEMTPYETLAEIYEELPVIPPKRFLETSLRRDYPNLSEQQIDKIIEETRPPEPDRLKSVYGFSCPTCGTWKPPSSMKRLLRELEKRDPELAAIIKERLKQQGLIA